jgi:predicted amidohydrolase
VSVLRVAAGQAAAVAGGGEESVRRNVGTAARLAALAGTQGVRLLVLPEAFLTGYDLEAFAGPLPTPEQATGALLDPLREAAAVAGCTVVVSTALQRPAYRTLSSLVVPPDGRAHAAYDKQHLDGVEKEFFTAGDHGASIMVDGIELGLSICYDGCFPEHARAAADDGALGYLASAAYFPGGAHRRDLYYAARALENGMYVVFSGLTGRCGASEFIGGSAVYDPEGRPVARLEEQEGLAVADLDTEVVAATRAQHTMGADRRADLGERIRL